MFGFSEDVLDEGTYCPGNEIELRFYEGMNWGWSSWAQEKHLGFQSTMS